ncbi:unnamed protein product [Pleuronectes platessa]|uniref:Uncharacterized protein n=1 Tax=Pleuronectes platessa TaxID=8262 RepID=A0A9N7YJK7_PLEPL|nr:unnamed protein product [Pleuronectes platessa]
MNLLWQSLSGPAYQDSISLTQDETHPGCLPCNAVSSHHTPTCSAAAGRGIPDNPQKVKGTICGQDLPSEQHCNLIGSPCLRLLNTRELYFHMMTFICARRQERDVCGATVITSFPESSRAMRPIYERASVVSTFPGKAPATLTVVGKGLRPKY